MPITPVKHPVALTLDKIVDEICEVIQERRTVVEVLVLTMLAKEHAFILGPPGTAKSMLCRALFGRIDNSKYFEALLSKTRPAEAILGPYDIPLLRGEGSLHRKYKGFLPDAHFALLDEIGKMGPTLGHDLLAVILERRLHQVNGGRSYVDVPLVTIIGGSNELPTDESEDAAALWDRLLVRLTVDSVQEQTNFAKLLLDTNDGSQGTRIDFQDLQPVIEKVVPEIPIPDEVVETVIQLKDELRAAEIVPSDRRWRQSMKLLRAAAFMDGREVVQVDDIQVLQHTLWDTPMQIKPVQRLTVSVSNPVAETALKLLDDIEAISTGLRDLKGQANDKVAQYGIEASTKLRLITNELSDKRQECLAAGKSVNKLDEVNNRLAAVKRQVYQDAFNMDMQAMADLGGK